MIIYWPCINYEENWKLKILSVNGSAINRSVKISQMSAQETFFFCLRHLWIHKGHVDDDDAGDANRRKEGTEITASVGRPAGLILVLSQYLGPLLFVIIS